MYKPIPLKDVMNSLEPGEREAIEARGKEILSRIDGRTTLAEMRKGRKISQAKLAESIGIQQMQVSRLEKRKDPRLSTLRRSIEAMGGQLTLIATFPDQDPMVLVAGDGN